MNILVKSVIFLNSFKYINNIQIQITILLFLFVENKTKSKKLSRTRTLKLKNVSKYNFNHINSLENIEKNL